MKAINARLIVLSAVLLAAAGFTATASVVETVPIRESFATFPMQIGEWKGQPLPPFEDDIMAVLGVDEYVNRNYYSARVPLNLYVGYYQSQRQGDAIHSPLNCLPGAGWEPSKRDYLSVDVAATSAAAASPVPLTITVNRYLIRKGSDTQVVLYWYQSQGRVVANEYWSKVYMVYDAMRSNRTDAAMVRVIVPVVGAGETAEHEAERQATDFVKAMYPFLGRYLPS